MGITASRPAQSNRCARLACALVVSLAALSLGVAAEPAAAQDGILAQLYGRGVHAYFDGDFEAAHRYLTDAVDGGTADPRVYFFRALTYQQLGRPDEAAADLTRGAELEVADVNNYYPVGRALQRIQGGQRLILERYRSEARLQQYQDAQQRRRQRFGTERPIPPPLRGEPLPLPPSDDADPAPVAGDGAVADDGAVAGDGADAGDDFKAEGNPFVDDPVEDEGGAAAAPADEARPDEASADDLFGDEDEAADEEATGEDAADEDTQDTTDEGDDFFGDDFAADETTADEPTPRVATAAVGSDTTDDETSEETSPPQTKLGKDGANAVGRGVLKLFGLGGNRSDGKAGGGNAGDGNAGDGAADAGAADAGGGFDEADGAGEADDFGDDDFGDSDSGDSDSGDSDSGDEFDDADFDDVDFGDE